MKVSPCWLGQVESAKTMNYQYGNQMDSMSEVWIPGVMGIEISVLASLIPTK